MFLIFTILVTGSVFSTVLASSSTIGTDIFTRNLTVTGTCSGCGAGESDFTNYNTIFLNTTVSAGFNNVIRNTLLSDSGDLMYVGGSDNVFVKHDGTLKFVNGSYSVQDQSTISQSSKGKYGIIIDDTSNLHVSIFKDGNYLQNLHLDTSQFCSPTANDGLGVAISPSGKYIVVVGQNATCDTNDRIVIFEGS